ncbi:hypothetical protein GCM10010345_65180 [Streptomyces canarius]|uniref:Uncharacterized protein n=1 Tax=Streptomyces canarius TaxID=285453 RepID=A0ABQ3D0J2_9ACTN|nr:hypothetical protein GCM10010345_65180 [Streptomyces canarius]
MALGRDGVRGRAPISVPIAHPHHTVADSTCDAIHAAVMCRIHIRHIRPDSSAGQVYVVLYDIDSEPRAQELAAALHAGSTPLGKQWGTGRGQCRRVRFRLWRG